METPHKTFSPFLWIGAALVVVLVLLATHKPAGESRPAILSAPVTDETPAPLPVEQSAVTHEGYVTAVTAIMTQYQAGEDASTTQQALLAMRVPSEDRDTHEALVTLLGKAMTGDEEEAQSRYATLKTTVTWLP